SAAVAVKFGAASPTSSAAYDDVANVSISTMNARSFFITGSGRSLPRSSSYEKGPRLAAYDEPAAADVRRGKRSLADRAAALVLGLAGALLAGCGSLPTNVGKTDSSALPPNPEGPLVKIA